MQTEIPNQPYGYIYVITNKINNKCYIGQNARGEMTEASKQKLSEAIKLSMTPEVRLKMSKCQIGKHHTEESKKKISEAFTGESNPNFGKSVPEERKRRISESLKRYYRIPAS